jgi:hypothetical protein
MSPEDVQNHIEEFVREEHGRRTGTPHAAGFPGGESVAARIIETSQRWTLAG